MAREPAGDCRHAGHMEYRSARTADAGGIAVRLAAGAPAGLSAATGDGEQRQAREARWHADHVANLRGDLGRARQQRAAFVLPAAASGYAARGDRFHTADQLIL